jgi:hypothetical protein
MTAKRKEDPLKHAKSNARGWVAHIEDLLDDLDKAEQADKFPAVDTARQRIEESVLSVQVRDGWRNPGERDRHEGPEEYELLLSTGGPALHIIGKLDEHNQPDTAEMQMQDWFQPWTAFPVDEKTLLRFARVFWFGE